MEYGFSAVEAYVYGDVIRRLTKEDRGKHITYSVLTDSRFREPNSLYDIMWFMAHYYRNAMTYLHGPAREEHIDLMRHLVPNLVREGHLTNKQRFIVDNAIRLAEKDRRESIETYLNHREYTLRALDKSDE